MWCCGERNYRSFVKGELAKYDCETAHAISKHLKNKIGVDDFEQVCLDYAGNITHIHAFINGVNERYILRNFLPMLQLRDFDFTIKKGGITSTFEPPIIINTGKELNVELIKDVDLIFNMENDIKIAIVILHSIFKSI
jgi:hypothetical protein